MVNMENGNKDLVLFEYEDVKLEVPVTPKQDTVWLTQEQMSILFDTARSSIAYHIGNIFNEGELTEETSVEIFDRSKKSSSRPPKYSYDHHVVKSPEGKKAIYL